VPDFVTGRYDTGFIERNRQLLLATEAPALHEPDEAMAAAVLLATLTAGESTEGERGRTGVGAAPSEAANAWATAARRRRLGY
jgi:hypothetical protein